MRAYIHSFEGRPWNEDCEAAYNGFTKLGIECVLFSSNEELEQRSEEDIVVGGMLIMEHVFNELEIKLPVYNYPEELNKYLGRQIKEIKLKDLNEEMLPIFIKPVEEKIAKGIVVESLEDLKEYELLDPETEIICSEPVRFVSEWRCFVRYGEVIGIQFYNGDVTIKPDNKIIDTAVREYISIPAACSLDFGVTEEGNTILIEMNDGFSIGAYGLNDELYSKFLMARWAEIVCIDDPFDQRLRTGYVEKFIQEELDRTEIAYLSIDVDSKTGNEIISSDLIASIKNHDSFVGMAIKLYLEKTKEKEVYITDDIVEFNNCYRLGTIIKAITYQDLQVHIRVKNEDVYRVESLLDKGLEKEIQMDSLFDQWRLQDRDFIIEIYKAGSGWEYEYLLRLYKDGNGVIVFWNEYERKTAYFILKKNLQKLIGDELEKKFHYIINNPEGVGADDIDNTKVIQVYYNVFHKYPDADKRINLSICWEYFIEECNNKIAYLILNAPEVKKYWMKLHSLEM